MASGFKPNRRGYLEVLNSNEVWGVCNKAGRNTCDALGGTAAGYAYDTIYGKRRVHTRVKSSYWNERKTHALMRCRPRM